MAGNASSNHDGASGGGDGSGDGGENGGVGGGKGSAAQLPALGSVLHSIIEAVPVPAMDWAIFMGLATVGSYPAFSIVHSFQSIVLT